MQDSQNRTVNSVDATVGQPIVARVQVRKLELETLLAGLGEHEKTTRGDLELALSTIKELLTGDLANVPPVVAADMNRWLERSKHLAERVAPITKGVANDDAGEMPDRSNAE